MCKFQYVVLDGNLNLIFVHSSCRIPVPFISSMVQGKLAIRAVLTHDEKLLQSLIQDVKRVCSVILKFLLESMNR